MHFKDISKNYVGISNFRGLCRKKPSRERDFTY